jgi:hypothetical protein
MTEEEWQHLYENFERRGPDYDDDYSASPMNRPQRLR